MSTNELMQSAMAASLFTAAMSLSPGPNNTIIASISTKYGGYKTLPFLLGVSIGVFVLMVFSFFGLSQVFEILPWLKTILKFLGFAYILYLAYKIWPSKLSLRLDNETSVLGFTHGILMQILNIKVLLMCIAITASFISPYKADYSVGLVFASLVAIIVLCANFVWAGIGLLANSFLSSPRHMRFFEIILSLSTAISSLLVFW